MSGVLPAGERLLREGRPVQPQLALVWLASLAIGALLLFALGLALGVRGDAILNHALGVLLAFVALVPLALDQGRAPVRRHLLLTLVALVHLVIFALPVWTDFFPNGSVMEFSDLIVLDSGWVALAQVAVLLGLLLLYAGYALPIPRILVAALPKPSHDWSHDVTLAVALSMVPLGLAIFLGSVVGLIPRSLGSGVLGVVSEAPYFAIALLTIGYLHFQSRAFLFFIVCLVPPMMGFFFFTAMKERFFMAPAMAVMALLVTRRQLPVRWMVVGVTAVVLFYPIAQAQRNFVLGTNLLQSLTNPAAVISAALEATSDARAREYILEGLGATANRTNGLKMVGVVLHDTPMRVPFQGGWSLAYIPISFVPRVLWPGKPVFDIGQTVTDLYGDYGVQSSTGLPWVGELYWNFGWPGIVVGMLFVGVFIRLFHELIFRDRMTVPLLLAGVIVCYDIARNVENFLLAPMSGMFFHLGPLVVAHLLLRNIRGSSRAPRGAAV